MNTKAALVPGLVLAIVGTLAWAQDETLFGARQVVADKAQVVVKGESVLEDATATVALPAWFEGQTQKSGRVVVVTCKGGHSTLSASEVLDCKFKVTTNELGSAKQGFFWIVVADRQ